MSLRLTLLWLRNRLRHLHYYETVHGQTREVQRGPVVQRGDARVTRFQKQKLQVCECGAYRWRNTYTEDGEDWKPFSSTDVTLLVKVEED